MATPDLPPPSFADKLLSLAFAVVVAPFQIPLILTTYSFSFLRPYAPQLVPVLICLLFIPIVVSVSLLAGWTVWTNLAVGWTSELFLQYGDGVQPYAHLELPPLVAQQPYDILLLLQVPPTEPNYALGNFMTTITLTNAKNKTLASVRRAAIAIPPRKSFFSLSSGPSLVEIPVPLLSSFVPGTSTIQAFVEIGRKDSWKAIGNGEARELSVYSASLRGILAQHGIRGLITRFPLTSSVLSSLIFSAVLFTILAVTVLPLAFQSSEHPAALEEPSSGLALPKEKAFESLETPMDEKPQKRRRRTKRSSSQPSVIKTEDDSDIGSTMSTSEDLAHNPLRRRRSRISHRLSDSD